MLKDEQSSALQQLCNVKEKEGVSVYSVEKHQMSQIPTGEYTKITTVDKNALRS